MCDNPDLVWLAAAPLMAIVAMALCWWIER